MNQRRRLIINVISNYISYFVFAISNFVLIGYLVRRLGSDAFGLVSLLISTTVFAELLGAGVAQALTKHISAAVEKKEADFINSFVSTGLFWFGICGIVGAIFFGICSVYLEEIVDIPSDMISDASVAMVLIAIRVLICFPFNAYRGVLLGHQRYDLVNMLRCFAIVLRVLFIIVYCEIMPPTITAVIAITIISLLVERVMWVLFSYKIVKKLKIKLSLVSRTSLMILLSFGIFIFIVEIANVLGYEAVKWVIGMELNIVDVGAYTLVASLAVVAGQLVRSISKVLVPVSSRYDALGLQNNNSILGFIGTKYAMIIASFLCLMPLLILRPFLSLWIGEQYSDEYMSTIAIMGIVLLLGQWFISTGLCLVQIVTGTGRVKFPALVTITWAICGIVICVVYLHFIQKSLLAVAIIMTLVRCIGTTAHVIYGIYILRINTIKFLSVSILKPAVAGIIACSATLGITPFANVYNVSGFILTGVLLALIYLFVIWIFVLSKEERRGIIKKSYSLKDQMLSKVSV